MGRRPRTPLTPALSGDDWAQASPARIERALARARALPAGGWYAVDASRLIDGNPRAYAVAGQRLVLWRDQGTLRAAPEACPHMGASLVGARVCDGALVCPWHGLRLGSGGHGAWRPLPAHDDGVLAWVRVDDGDPPTDAPILAPRPSGPCLDAVIRMEARCEPADILANRLDPWHGAHFHPYAFADLTVTRADDEALELRVAYRIAGPLVMEVDARFHCPDRRTIVMTIIDGDGAGSVVETHATPMGPGRTAVVEATIATSERRGFGVAARLGPLLRGMVARQAERLWADDIAYAERRAWLRWRDS
ncbi:MAG: Rieske 2Fe-2S domain-containing protein [Deltaproteobacteria bacterium]|nr:Rieske 2Fe-2S domain-containing protein [Deltaproteobacteria bacterium]MCB9787483.1 Rieske 2Fe-2S domain-containing protein [Deltaproteobacteria bacterium]